MFEALVIIVFAQGSLVLKPEPPKVFATRSECVLETQRIKAAIHLPQMWKPLLERFGPPDEIRGECRQVVDLNQKGA